MFRRLPIALAAIALVSGCRDTTSPRDRTAPAAPRGVYSVTGDGEVFLHWLPNTESDVVGYRVYEAPCANGPSCPYDLVGTTSTTSMTVSGLANGVTRYFDVSAVDRAGNESAPTEEVFFDTPRPEAFGQPLVSDRIAPGSSGWDFSAAAVRTKLDPLTDMYFDGRSRLMLASALPNQSDIQDAGYASTLDAVDVAPANGWSPTGTVELITGHCYVVWTADNHFAKFRVTSLDTTQVVFDWAYQVDAGNPELRMRPAPGGSLSVQAVGPSGIVPPRRNAAHPLRRTTVALP